jgi:hypothetical protein
VLRIQQKQYTALSPHAVKVLLKENAKGLKIWQEVVSFCRITDSQLDAQCI